MIAPEAETPEGCPACNWVAAIDAGEVEAYRRGAEIRQREDGELVCQRCGRIIT